MCAVLPRLRRTSRTSDSGVSGKEGKASAVEQDGAHLSCDCRVQITPQLLEVRVRRVFHLESLLSKNKEGKEKKESETSEMERNTGQEKDVR